MGFFSQPAERLIRDTRGDFSLSLSEPFGHSWVWTEGREC